MRKLKVFLSFLLMITMTVSFLPSVQATAAEEVPVRTVMMYCCGSDLESDSAFASENLKQAMLSDYNENLNFIVITGGARRWRLGQEYLTGASAVSADYNQVWKLTGKSENESHGRMKLLKERGLPGCSKYHMSDPELLTAFIDYCYHNYPADVYDLIFWDHGAGPVYGHSYDDNSYDYMTLPETVGALADSTFYKSGNRFGFIDFDLCLMSNVEIIAAISEFTDVLIASPEEEPGAGQHYTGWLNAVKEDPYIDAYDIGIRIVDDFIDKYTIERDGYPTILSVVNVKNFKQRVLPYIGAISELLVEQALTPDAGCDLLSVYDEIYSMRTVTEYGSTDYDLFDIGQYAAILGCIQTEFDAAYTETAPAPNNLYTECSVRILEALADRDNSGDDVIYSGYIDVADKGSPFMYACTAEGGFASTDNDDYNRIAGISIFFPSDVPRNSYEYIDQMTELSAAMPDGEPRSFINEHIKTTAYYALITALLSSAAKEANDGVTNITYAQLKSKMTSDRIWDPYISGIIRYLVSSGEFENNDAVETYLSDAVSDQVAMSISPDKTAAKQVKDASGGVESYRLTVSSASPHLISSVHSAVKINQIGSDLDTKMLLSFRGYTYKDINKLFKDGFVLNASRSFGEREYGKYVNEFSDDETAVRQRAYTDSDYTAYLTKTECALTYINRANGTQQLSWMIYTNDEKTEGYIPVIVMEKRIYEYNYYVYFKLTGGEWRLSGWSKNIAPEDERVYAAADEIYTAGVTLTYAPGSLMTDSVYRITSLLPTAGFLSIANVNDVTGITLTPVTEDDMTGGGVGAEYCWQISDIFGFVYDIKYAFSTADAAAQTGDFITDLSGAEITVEETVFNGEAQRPAVTVQIGQTTLAEGVDYRVLYDGSAGPGEAQLMIIGMGEYCGYTTVTYVIAENTALKGDVNGDGAVNGKDLVRLRRYLIEFGDDPSEVTVVIFPGADLNGDGAVNGKDLIRLRKLLVAV